MTIYVALDEARLEADELLSQLTACDARIADLENEVAGLEAALLDARAADVEALWVEIETLKADFAILGESLSAANVTIAAKDEEIFTLRARIAELEAPPVEGPPPAEEPPPPPPPVGIEVSSASQLATALANAKGGEVIVLNDGDFGSLLHKRKYASQVVIAARNPLKAKFSGNVRLEDATNIAFVNIAMPGQFYSIRTVGVVLNGCDISGGHNTVIFNDAGKFRIENCTIRGARSDLLRITGNSYDGKILNNTLRDVAALSGDHPDAMQFFGNANGAPRDMLIRGNYIYDNPATGGVYGQGIFVKDATYRRFTIEQNLIAIGSPNSIYVMSGEEAIIIRNNSVMSWEPGGGGGCIRLVGDCSGTTVDANVCLKLLNESSGSAKVLDNVVTTDFASLYQGPGSTWQGFLPKPGSRIDFGSRYGAQVRLKELMG
jgi:hypothetical protein